MRWRGLYNPERHRGEFLDPDVAECSCCECMFCAKDQPCRCCLEAQAAAVAAVIAPHIEAVGWQCPCCSAVDAALRGQS